MARKHNVDEVTRSLSRKKDCKVNIAAKTIQILKSTASGHSGDLGNGSWGKVDFLVNYGGFTLNMVSKFES